jgi:hypothetical protein
MSPANLPRFLFMTLFVASCANADPFKIKVERLPDNPILTTESSRTLGNNVNGPSIIRVPDWVEAPLGKYYLYFAHHKGKYIRLAYADHVEGPWKIHESGVLQLEDSYFPTGTLHLDALPEARRKQVENMRAAGYDPLYTHVASPEVVVVPEKQEIRLYYHGMTENASQATRVATSTDGLNFDALPAIIARPYLRIFKWQGKHYGLAMPGVFYRSDDGLTGFEEGPTLFNPDMRHCALMIRDSTLYVFWTQAGHAPEHIMVSTIELSGDWLSWKESEPVEILRPVTEWEGANLPVEPSRRGAIEEPVNQLRDPEIFEEDGKVWLLYSIAGETGLAIARLELIGFEDQ